MTLAALPLAGLLAQPLLAAAGPPPPVREPSALARSIAAAPLRATAAGPSLGSDRLALAQEAMIGPVSPLPKKGWIRRHPVLFGALVGFGSGCVFGVSRVGGSQDNFFNALDEFACPAVGAMGAAAGAAIGWAVSR